MAKSPVPSRQLPSVFDRLLDLDPDRPQDARLSQRQLLQGHKNSIRRDLEVLLNTQQPSRRIADSRPEIPTSLLQYGSPGFHGLMLATREQHLALARSLQELIGIFEPRLRNVRVTLGDDKTRSLRALSLKIRAETRFDDTDETVTFDTQLDPSTRQFRVVGGASNG